MKRLSFLAVLMVVCFVSFVCAQQATEPAKPAAPSAPTAPKPAAPAVKKVIGEVVSIDTATATITVKDKAGKSETLDVSAKAKIKKAGKAIALGDISAGDKVTVYYKTVKGKKNRHQHLRFWEVKRYLKKKGRRLSAFYVGSPLLDFYVCLPAQPARKQFKLNIRYSTWYSCFYTSGKVIFLKNLHFLFF
jgi:hypothetical protein